MPRAGFLFWHKTNDFWARVSPPPFPGSRHESAGIMPGLSSESERNDPERPVWLSSLVVKEQGKPPTRPTCLGVNKSFDLNISSGPDRFGPDSINQFEAQRPSLIWICGPNGGVLRDAYKTQTFSNAHFNLTVLICAPLTF